ncbi:TrkA-N domain dehydrogenase [Aspergillus bombycis]|uniref:TrkA-N domain dehydrogenase n=1 Tax=Aspergillus bombycis TaxID=109264 RepID=A0A1F7ZTR1_9EURO|nr:TrkA-N domain dehydrogenase [Aspergillus bombycis]OGM42669.1 TrkA-N domain dehydrogenase [Aspergillus bombycis]
MHVLIIGGSGRTGQLTIVELLRRGHQVTALVRNPSAMKQQLGLKLVQGTPTSRDDVWAAFHIDVPDVVIVTLNSPRASDSPFAAPISPPRLMADCNNNVISAMKEFGVKKVVILQAFGVGDSWKNMNCALQLLMKKSNMIYQYEDHNHTDREVRASGIDFVLVRPSRLVDTDVREVKFWPQDGKGVPLMASTSRVSVAGWLVDAAERTDWDNTAPVITN